jgi:fatty acid desaturase
MTGRIRLLRRKGPSPAVLRELEMRKPTLVEFANGFLWLAVLAGSIILFWGSDRLWMMVVIVLANGFASMGVVARSCQRSD